MRVFLEPARFCCVRQVDILHGVSYHFGKFNGLPSMLISGYHSEIERGDGRLL